MLEGLCIALLATVATLSAEAVITANPVTAVNHEKRMKCQTHASYNWRYDHYSSKAYARRYCLDIGECTR